MIAKVKLLSLLIFLALECACTMSPYDQYDKYNRRDLYSPEPEPGSPEAARQLEPHRSPTPEPKPQFR